jgi:hypothetical protein
MLTEDEIREQLAIHRDGANSPFTSKKKEDKALRLMHQIAVMVLEGVVGEAPTLVDQIGEYEADFIRSAFRGLAERDRAARRMIDD